MIQHLLYNHPQRFVAPIALQLHLKRIAVFTELLYVLALSRKTQFILGIGVLFFVGLMIGGEYAVSSLELKSLPASVAEAIREKVLHRYDKAAWAILGVSLLGAIKAYRNDRKRFGL